MVEEKKKKRFSCGIAGVGMVGSALKKYLEKQDCELFLYDDFKGIGFPETLNYADYIYICVPTKTVSGVCDTSIIKRVLKRIRGNKVIIIKSTVLPGTTNELQREYPQHKILFNPEFLTELSADIDMERPDKQIIGYTNKSKDEAENVLDQLPPAPLQKIVPAHVAEFIKYASNTYFSVKVCKNNELYDVFKKYGGSDSEFEAITRCLMSDPRIGNSHFDIWYGGYRGYGDPTVSKCLPKDTEAFINFAKKLGVEVPISEAAHLYNRKLWKTRKI